MKKSLSTSVRYLKGIGPKRAGDLKKLGIESIEDLLNYFPRRYEDRTNFLPIAKLQQGQIQTIKAEVIAKAQRKSFYRRGFSITEITVADKTGRITCVWFNQPYLKDYFQVGDSLVLYGKIEEYHQKLQMSNPEFEAVSGEGNESLNTGRIVPIYTLTQGLSQRYFRSVIKNALDDYLPQVSEVLSYDLRSRNNLLNLAKSLLQIHFPTGLDLQKQAYERLAFEEFFLFQLPLALRKLKKNQKRGIAHKTEGELTRRFIESLLFKFTDAQKRVIAEIGKDMAGIHTMQRLLQGDVGSGKTVVATLACLMAIQGGYQAVFMVPTEILARQHFEKISSQVANLKPEAEDIKLGLLTSSADKKEKEKIYRQIKSGKLNFIIGTHALLEQAVQFKNLGLVVIDEQHKFGVGQRALLPQKGTNPDVLIMTATPIPRTLAITLYADLDISVINELPPGRLPVETVHLQEEERPQAYQKVREELSCGHQAYIIYPVIDESYALDIAGAKRMYEELKRKEFKGYRLGLIHGRLKQEEQDQAMSGFKNKELDLLVATTVLEVGIDIPNATCMLIESAERFGLSQLHQLRGRIGRGGLKSYCILISGDSTAQAQARLSAMARYSDGFRIAEEDLRIRGPGEFFGSRQHGLTELKIGDPLAQMQLLKRAREEAVALLKTDACLSAKPNLLLKEKLLRRFPEYEKLILVG